jgi:hypothetical protein
MTCKNSCEGSVPRCFVFDECTAARMLVLSGLFVNGGISSRFDDQNLPILYKCKRCLCEDQRV